MRYLVQNRCRNGFHFVRDSVPVIELEVFQVNGIERRGVVISCIVFERELAEMADGVVGVTGTWSVVDRICIAALGTYVIVGPC